MLRITTHDHGDFLTFQLEGKLAGPWVQEMERCWDTTVVHGSPDPALSGTVGRPATTETHTVRIDLTGVTFVDHAGKHLLAALHGKGVQFVLSGCLMKALMAEITRASPPTRGWPEEVDERQAE
jgi:hypothetical protein